MRARRPVAIREWPPSSKKLSWIPTASSPNASVQIEASSFSTSVRARYSRWAPEHLSPSDRAAPCGPACRWGSAAAVERHERRRHHVLRQQRPQVLAQVAARPVAASRPGRRRRRRAGVARPVLARHHHRRLHIGRCRTAPPRSRPSSMRKPRSFTWWSSRPRYSSVPSGSHRPRSPVGTARAGRTVRVSR